MKRRDLMFLAAAAAAGRPFAAYAQAPQKLRRVGILLGYPEGDKEGLLRVATLARNLSKQGWSENRDIRYDVRLSGNAPEKLRSDARELAALAPDVIVVQGNRPLTILKQVTSTIPIVFAQVADPVGGKLIDNLARPGGNATGFTNFEASMGGKWVEALKDIWPSLGSVAVLYHPDTAANIAYWKAAEAAAQAMGISAVPLGVQHANAIEQALLAAAAPSRGLVVMPHDVTTGNRDLILALTAKQRLPAVYAYRFFVTLGGLASYDFNYVEQWQQVANYVHRILRGERPADLPVQAPTKFELAINLKTARALGLDIPALVLGRADEVIE